MGKQSQLQLLRTEVELGLQVGVEFDNKKISYIGKESIGIGYILFSPSLNKSKYRLLGKNRITSWS